MKKFISVLIVAFMLMSFMSFASFARGAGECNCPMGVHVSSNCRCCVYCDKFEDTYLLPCCNPYTGTFCCDDCNGVYDAIKGCGCYCECCERGDQTNDKYDSTFDEFWTPQDQINFVDGFQALMKQFSDRIDELFNQIFEFLKLEQVLGKISR